MRPLLIVDLSHSECRALAMAFPTGTATSNHDRPRTMTVLRKILLGAQDGEDGAAFKFERVMGEDIGAATVLRALVVSAVRCRQAESDTKRIRSRLAEVLRDADDFLDTQVVERIAALDEPR